MRLETEQVGKPGLKDLQGGAMPPFSMGAYTDGDVGLFREHQGNHP